MLSNLAAQNHYEHTDLLFCAGAVPPLVQILSTGSAKAQAAASTALHAIAHDKVAHQAALVDAGGVLPLVKGGGSVAQVRAQAENASVGAGPEAARVCSSAERS